MYDLYASELRPNPMLPSLARAMSVNGTVDTNDVETLTNSPTLGYILGPTLLCYDASSNWPIMHDIEDPSIGLQKGMELVVVA